MAEIPGDSRTGRERSGRGASAAPVIAALGALAQETRLAIFRRLVEHAPDGLTPGAIVEALKVPQATLSFHLKELAAAGLTTDRRKGRHIWYRANLAAINELSDYLTENCCRATNAAPCAPACAPDACGPSPKRSRRKS